MGSSTFKILALVFLARTAAAQELEQPDTTQIPRGPQHVAGQVVRPGKDKMLPVPNVYVTLHRVGTDHAAPLDSVRADDAGHYAFDFRRSGEPGAIYFVSAMYGGVAYFTPPLQHSTVTGEEAEIAVFDTTSGPVPISIRGHHVIVSAVDVNAERSVTEVFELANDSSVTRVPSASGSAVWSSLLPAGAKSFKVTQGDVPSAAIKFEDGKAQVYAPLAPGLKQIAITYSMPARNFPMSIPVVKETQIFEVLIEEQQGSVTAPQVKEVEPVALEKRSFRRFLGPDVPAGSIVTIDLAAAEKKTDIDPKFMVALTVIIGGAMVFALARALKRR
ncbi:MAG TPA: hypothetical protein VM053_03950 [Gemmatimonadaceae bacterium]|nr:hypothetical protein [Gemmatimonadaceae bacterium]